MFAHVEQFPFELGGNGGFAGAGQSGEPDDVAGVVVAQGALLLIVVQRLEDTFREDQGLNDDHGRLYANGAGRDNQRIKCLDRHNDWHQPPRRSFLHAPAVGCMPS
jgi:hypothetical protein